MIYSAIKEPLLELLRAPTDPPEPPIGSPDSVRTFRASPNFLRLRILLHFLSITPALILEVLFVFTEQAVSAHGAATAASLTVLVLTAFVAVLRYFLLRLDYDMRYYIITDRSLRIRQGALTVHESTYTFANVQNLSIRQGPVERLFGISSLIVETAGGSSPSSQNEQGGSLYHRGTLAGIENAAEVRDRVLTLLKAYRDAGLGDREESGQAARREQTAESRDSRDPWTPPLHEILAELRALKAALDR